MSLSDRYKVNSPKVIYEFFEGEVVIVNLESGCYYSTDKTGFAIFSELIANASVPEIIDSLSRKYKSPKEKISQSINEFVTQLNAELLIIPSDSSQQSQPSGPSAATPPSRPVSEFELPVLNKYSDMKDLLLLDPIHDVDEKGWPIAKK